MQKKVFLLLVFIAVTGIQSLFAQYITKEQYVQMNKDVAIREMKRMGVPAAIKLAQGILETENGNSELLKKSNNHFGIKCKSTWTSGGVSHDDDEKGECFRVYKNAEESYRDHSNFLRGNQRYAFLFKLDPKDYKAWAYGLKKAGYATNPRYPQMIIKYIEDNNLQQYTLEGMSEVAIFDPSKYTDDPEQKQQPEETTAAVPSTEKVTINGSKAIYAPKGTSLLAIATNNRIKLEKLMEYNDLLEEGLLDQSQYIFLEKKSKEGDKDFVVLQKDESLYDIAQNNGVQFDRLLEYNGLREDQQLAVGLRIYLKPGKKDVALLYDKTIVNPSSSKNTAFKTHAVQPKEGLYAISKKYGVTVAQLRDWNQLPDDNLKVGQELIISK